MLRNQLMGEAMKTDLQGHAYAELNKLKSGDKVKADGGFPCIKKDAVLEVSADETGELFIPCTSGRHYVEGQLDDDGNSLIGLYPVS